MVPDCFSPASKRIVRTGTKTRSGMKKSELPPKNADSGLAAPEATALRA